MMRSSALFVAASIALCACSEDTVNMYVMTSETPVVHADHSGTLAIAHGVAIAVQPSMIHEEIEGATALPVTDVRSDDPSTLAVKPTSHSYDVPLTASPNDRAWVLIGVGAGSTKLRLYRDDDEVDVITVDVIAQVP